MPQLDCQGAACRDYQPSAIQCTNAGGTDVDIDWKCEADLPSSLRFGRLQVSCEGWDGPDDSYVLKGSCGLTYSLVRVPQHSQTSPEHTASAYTYLYIPILLVVIYLLITRLFPRFINPSRPSTTNRSTPGGGGGSYRGGGPTSSDSHARYAPPPPYTKSTPNPNPPPTQTQTGDAWAPGFWTGLGAGGLAAASYHYLTRPREPYRPTAGSDRQTWDWERPTTAGSWFARPEPSAARRRFDRDNPDGSSRAGSSTGPGTQLGEMRRATGFGRSSVR